MIEGKKRSAYIDIAKGIGMLAVIWGHIFTDYSSPSVILVYAFDIPLFFFLAGMTYNGKKYDTLGKLVKSRAVSLLLPYVVYSVITWLLWAGMQLVSHSGRKIFPPLLQTLFAQGSGTFLVHNIPLWFVTCLFVVEILYYFISKTNDVCNVLICIAMACAGHFMLNNDLDFDFRRLPWNIEAAMSAMLFYCCGNLFVKHLGFDLVPKLTSAHKAAALAACAAAAAVFAAGALWNGHITLGSNQLGRNTILLYTNGFLGTAVVIALSAVLASTQNKWGSAAGRGIRWIGEHSFDYMAVHVPIKGILAIVVSKPLHTSAEGISRSVWQAGIVYVLSLAVSTVIVLGISRLKGRYAEKRK